MPTTFHGLWIPSTGSQFGEFFLWAEDDALARRKGHPADHPFALSASQIVHNLWQLSRELPTQRLQEGARRYPLILPSDERRPLPSAPPAAPEAATEAAVRRKRKPVEPQLRIWRVEGVPLSPSLALTFLLGAQATSPYYRYSFGPDFSFWQTAARLAALIVVRGQFLPAADEDGKGYWRMLLAETEIAEAAVNLARAMPPATRALARPLPAALDLLHSFLAETVNDYVQQSHTPQRSPFFDPKKYQPKPHHPTPADFWWLDLFPRQRHNFSTLARSGAEQAAFGERVRAWSLKAYDYMASPMRVAFRLEPPQAVETVDDAQWRLSFHLQPKDAPETLWAASEVWENAPQPEMPAWLQAGLAQAASFYAPLLPVLNETNPEAVLLTTAEAVEFLEKHAEVLSARGFGVLVPGWWKQRKRRLSVGLDFSREGSGLLGMNTLVDFNWKVAVGDKALTLDELSELAQSKTALVQVRGEWMQFDPNEVQAALKLAQRHQKNSGKLGLGEALSLALAGPGEWDGLQIEAVETDAWLDELIARLSGHQPLEKLEQPSGFVGQLRPYQLNGLSWLAFLRQYGFGACLADDMGLGKCLLPDARVFVNGTLKSIEQLWHNHAGPTTLDSEGEWALPNAPLQVNALREGDGQITAAEVRRLYRQKINTVVRRFTLEDGQQITVTQRHKLFTRDGWTTHITAGDYVAVPAKLVWEGTPLSPELAEFLAWQIAEGYEQTARSTLTITQKDEARLRRLQALAAQLGQQFNLNFNRPAIQRYRHAPRRAPHLSINSVAYRQYLEAQGYAWGKLSREKALPEFLMTADLAAVRVFLRHFFEAEGSVSLKMRCVEISSASELLLQQISTLLRRFGIWLRVARKRKRATNGKNIYREYFAGTLGGASARRFLAEVGFAGEYKQNRLVQICQTKSNTNVESYPASDWMAEVVAKTQLPVRHFGLPNAVYLTGSQQFSRVSLQHTIVGLERILNGEAEAAYRALPTSRWTQKTLAAYENLDRAPVADLHARLMAMARQEVFFCRVKKVEEFVYAGWVYDLEVAEHHNFVANNILCHNTIQVLALLAKDHDEQALTKPILLVCPTTVVNNWVREAAKFAPQLKCYAHHGPQRHKAEKFIEDVKGYHLVITSYALLPRDAEFIEKVEWGGVVLDEAHNIKNPVTKQAQVSRRLNAAYRFALTGTPLENRLQDLWSILHFINPGYLGSAETFQRTYAGPIERGLDTSASERLRALTGPFILRRLKTDTSIIKDLPPKNEMKEYCGLTKEQAALYRAVTQESLRQIAASNGIQRRGVILATLTKLKQVCNHPRHLLGDGSELRHRSGKLNRLMEMLEQALAEDDRVLIFTQYAEMGELLKEALTHEFGEVLYLYGGTPATKRASMIEHFQNGGPKLFVLSLKAGGAGINLTRANRVFHYDRWWNPAVENQATDRAFRIGQTQTVQVHKMICRGTLEERIDELITRKMALAESVVGAGESWLTELSTDELRDLLLLRKEAVDD